MGSLKKLNIATEGLEKELTQSEARVKTHLGVESLLEVSLALTLSLSSPVLGAGLSSPDHPTLRPDYTLLPPLIPMRAPIPSTMA